MKTEFNLKDEIAVLEMELRYDNLGQLKFFRKLDEIMEEFIRELKEELGGFAYGDIILNKINKLAGEHLKENKK